MSLLWFVAFASLAVALLAWRQARAAARRAEQLSQMYWELKYQQGELRVQLQRGGSGDTVAKAAPAHDPDGFIPLSSLKR
jgi:hypothetical protein